MTQMIETDDDELPVTHETIEKAIGLVHEYVAELREMLRTHLTDLHATTITTAHATMPSSLASQEPQHTARIHRLAIGCDAFIDAMSGCIDRRQ
jgi:hypothetical protein